jgi:hypothetical protein
MKYYKDADNQVYAYESDGSQDAYIPEDLILITEEEADELRKPPPPTSDELENQFKAAVTQKLNNFARANGYDDINSARLASDSYAADGDIARKAWSGIWDAALPLLSDVRSGALTVTEALAQLPALAWPASGE